MGLFIINYLPEAVLANDITGIVVETGPNVTKFSIGDRIFGQSSIPAGSDSAGLQEFCVLDANHSAVIPSSVSFDEAVTYPINAETSFITFFDPSGFDLKLPSSQNPRDYSKDSVLIIGGGSNCGKFGLQFARLAGFGTIVTTAGTRKQGQEEYLRSLGATHVINRNAPDVAEQIQSIVGDDLLYVYDTVNGGEEEEVSFQLGLKVLSTSRKGTLATLLRGKVDPVIAEEKKAGFDRKRIFGSSHVHEESGIKFWKEIGRWIEEGKIQPTLDFQRIHGLDAEKVNKALDGYRDGIPTLRVHVYPNPEN